MFARSLALLALASIPALAGDSPANTLTVYVKAGMADPASVLYMKLELGRLMQSAGYLTEWLDAPAVPDVANGQLVVLELQGACSPRGIFAAPIPDAAPDSLASTAVSNGSILPFSALHCEVLNRVVGRAIAAAPGGHLSFLYGRALARLAAHEFYHILTGDAEHTHCGISKSSFSTDDLLTDGFEFEAAALVKLRTPSPVYAPPTSLAAESTGR
jgi:hypothetical protein